MKTITITLLILFSGNAFAWTAPLSERIGTATWNDFWDQDPRPTKRPPPAFRENRDQGQMSMAESNDSGESNETDDSNEGNPNPDSNDGSWGDTNGYEGNDESETNEGN